VPDDGVHYPWYQVTMGGTLEQGDILRAFEVMVPTSEFSEGIDTYSVELKAFDVVIMTQSCDIELGKSNSLLLCPLFSLWDILPSPVGRGCDFVRPIRSIWPRHLPDSSCASVCRWIFPKTVSSVSAKAWDVGPSTVPESVPL
jgi:hypothetical protein